MSLLLMAFAASLMFGAAPVRANSGAAAAIHLKACIAPQQPGDDAATVFRDAARFDCVKSGPEWGPGSFWVRFDLPVQSGADSEHAVPHTRELRLIPAWQRMITVYSRDTTGKVVARPLDNADLTRMTAIGGAIDIPLDGHAAPVSQILLRVDGALNASGIVSDPQLLDEAGRDGEELVAAAVFAAFAGLGLGLFCYNIVLWLTIRERFQLTYCLSLLAMLAYTWSSSGTMAVQFPFLSHTLRLQTSYIMLAFVAALALQFITDFIEQSKLPRRLRFIARHTGLGVLAAALLVIFVPDQWRYLADRLYVVSFLPLPVLVVSMTVIAWRRGSRSVRVLAIAWVVPLAMAVLRIAHALHLIDFGPMVQYALVAAMSLEALLSSLAMSFRIKLITDERDRALADERAARYLASIDSLTGLLNRRALLEQLIAWESPEPLRLLLVDIDHFKLINDRHGHLVGDEVLREVAEVLAMRTELRGSVARLGGEEFALIGTADELHEGIALAILSDIRARLMAGSVRLTVSVGMAEGMVRCEDEWRELYRRADAALYQAKSEGRNRAIHAGPAATSQNEDGSFGTNASLA